MSALHLLAPRFSKRRLMLSILRDFYYRPRSIFGRLSRINFENDRICRSLVMHCNVCGSEGHMSYDYPDVHIRMAHGIGLLRETLRCKSCSASMRHRQLALGLMQVIEEKFGQSVPDLATYRKKPLGKLRILDTDSFSPINRVMRGLPGYIHSQYVPNYKNGDVLPDGSVMVNLECIPYPESSFEIVLTSDVMEHVANDAFAHKEIFRALCPGGRYIFTVPYDPSMNRHRLLTVPTGAGEGATHLYLEKHMHGDPHSGAGILAHRIYGVQIFDDLARLGFNTGFQSIQRPENGIFGGDLFTARKGS